MCIISVKQMGIPFMPVATFMNCIENNPDGFAFMWNEKGKLKNYKTMDPQEALSFYKKFISEYDYEKTTLVFHARIATHGTKIIDNCHCWIENNVGFAHNGVMSDFSNKENKTDSEIFFRNFFMPVYNKSGEKYAFLLADIMADRFNSRFVFLGPKGYALRFGSGRYKDQLGVIYSNRSFSYPSSWKRTVPEHTFPQDSIFGKH